MTLHFGEFCLASEKRLLTRNGEPVQISLKALRLLEFLLEKRPKAVSARDLHRLVWPDTHVVRANLRNLMVEVRAATGDPASSPRFIRTIFGFGYSFCGEVVEGPGPERIISRYQLFLDAAPYPLFEGENVVGRDATGTVVIDGPGISRRHAVLFILDDQIFLEDLESKNGTFVDAERVRKKVPVREGAQIRFGHLTTRIRANPTGGSTLTEL